MVEAQYRNNDKFEKRLARTCEPFFMA